MALADAASSVRIIDSTSLMLIRTFSGFKSVGRWSLGGREREKQWTGVNYTATTVHVIQTYENLLCTVLVVENMYNSGLQREGRMDTANGWEGQFEWLISMIEEHIQRFLTFSNDFFTA